MVEKVIQVTEESGSDFSRVGSVEVAEPLRGKIQEVMVLVSRVRLKPER